ncbi:hypothetical protein [Pseudogulbenkiania subflava]|uniref:Uncharacterized protein n=1 Tax=Pseudogulbenkiania subflava DSM 22618 TaxID=1123014 RepID=A0A1Y6B988_9NEIS|nr:hypothetical protein [Pseudogulbenkiania subflava]SME91313.1 hypothetical protein SAMN02745746_00004 [Pseudogulbenkiania subflava DSM 22618]
MQIERAALIPGTEQSLGEGNSQPFRAQVRLSTGGIATVICKRLEQHKIAAECFAALVLRAWGIATPAPCIVLAGNEVLYGSQDAAYPNLKQRLGWSDHLPDQYKEKLIVAAATLLASWPQTGAVIAADEAIHNVDRHIGQVLWDGGEPVWVDHDQSLGVADGNLPDLNKLAWLLGSLGLHSQIQTSAVSHALMLPGNELLEAAESAAEAGAYQFAEFVANRLPALASRVVARFPQPNDLFAGLQ